VTVLKKTFIVAALLFSAAAVAQDNKVLNLCSSRHYQTDEALYADFTRQTGIKINRIEAGEDPLIERIRNEGERSPADVLVTVDAGRLWRAEQLGLFQPVKSATLESRIPESYREPGGRWFGFSLRTRLIAYNKAKVRPGEIRTYEELADPKWKGRVCMRSSTSIYNLSLMGALIDHLGEQKAEAWAKGVHANLAQEPRGGDTDQLKAVAAGGVFISPSVAQFLMRRHQRTSALKERKKGLVTLTPTERRILWLVAENKTNKEIGSDLFISHRTVETHRSHICEKLELSGNHALLAFALEHKSQI